MSDESHTITNNITPGPALGNEHTLFEIQKSLIRVENNQEISRIKLDGVVELVKKDVSTLKLDYEGHKKEVDNRLVRIEDELDKKVVEKAELDELRKIDECNTQQGIKNSESIAKITAVGGAISLALVAACTVIGGWVSAVAAHH